MNNQVNQGRRICLKCGAMLDPNSAFCAACGTPVPKQAPAPQAQQFVFCTNCGNKYPAGAPFCTNCGKPSQGAPAGNMQRPAPMGNPAPMGPQRPAPNFAPQISKEEQDRRAYEQAIQLFAAQRYDQALPIFAKLGDFLDSREKVKECTEARDLARKEQIYAMASACLAAPQATDVDMRNAINNLKSIGDYKDSANKLAELNNRLGIYLKNKAAAEEAERARKAAKKKRTKSILIFAIICFVITAIVVAGIVVINIPFNIEYDLDGGIVIEGNPDSYTAMTDGLEINNPTRKGYIFAGWKGDGIDGTDVVINRFNFGDKKLTATWTPKEYTITFNSDGGNTLADLKVTYDRAYSLPIPTRTGYSFDGWYANGSHITDGTWRKDADLTLVARWTPNEYTITFDDIGEKEYLVITYDYNYSGRSDYTDYLYDGYTLSMPSAPSRTGYVFTGWYTDSACTNRYDFTGVVTNDMTLYAGWQYMSMSYAYDQYEIDPTYYDSSSWYYSSSTGSTSSNYKKHFYVVAQEAGNHRIYYKNSSYSSSYRFYIQIYNLTKGTTILSNTSCSSTSYDYVSFNCSAGDVIVVSIYRYNYSSTAYLYFTGFYDQTSSATGSVSGLVYDPDSYYSYTQDVTFDQEITLPVVARPGYRFVGWFYGNTKVESGKWTIDSDVTLTPRYEEIVYHDVTFDDALALSQSVTVTFDYNYSGRSDTVVELDDGEVLAYPEIPSRSGYLFGGWYMDSACTNAYSFSGTINSDITLYAKWISIYVSNNSYPSWSVSGNTLYSNNTSNSSSSYYTITAQTAMTVRFNYYTSSESGCDYLYILKNNETIISCSGITDPESYSISLDVGDTLTFVYSKDGSVYYGDDKAYITDLSAAPVVTSTAVANRSTVAGLVYSNGSSYTVEVGYGEYFTLPTITRSGYTFLGWYHGGDKVESGLWQISGDCTLTASWRRN